MKFVRAIWLITLIVQLGFMLRWYLKGTLDWDGGIGLLLLISTMPFAKFEDFNILKKNKQLIFKGMKYLFTLLVSVLLLGCRKPDCFEIYRKYGGDGNYYFEWNDFRVGSGNQDSMAQNPTTLVSEQVYNQYDIGDTYCLEQIVTS